MEMERAIRMLRVMVLVLASVLLAACGAEDDGDEDAPDAQPTVAVTDEAGGTPTEPPGVAVAQSPVPAGTAVPEGEGTPVTATAEPVVDLVPPETGTDSATPAPDDEAAEPATPEADEDGGSGSVPGDGTTGAQVDLGSTPVPATAATPVPDSTPAATPATSTEPVAVTGCEVADVPPFQGEQTAFVVTVDVNFRVGPGTDCDLALGEPIGEFQIVEVIGGPVIREDDGSEWVQIEVLGTQGWVAFEFLEPAPQE